MAKLIDDDLKSPTYCMVKHDVICSIVMCQCIASLFAMYAKFPDQIKLVMIKHTLENMCTFSILSFINMDYYNSILYSD